MSDQPTPETERVRGKELMCDQCGCTRWACLTKFDGACCTGCQHPSTEIDQIDQTIFADDPKRKGNCVAACVATVLGVPLDRVPHFIEFGIAYGDSDDVAEVSHGNNWWAMMLGFLAGHGLWVVELDEVTDAEGGEFVLVAGMSPRGVVHQVVYRAGRLWHDPHPSRAGVLDVREVLAIRPLPGFDHAPAEPVSTPVQRPGCD